MCPFYAWQSNTSLKKYRSNHSKNNSLTVPRPFLERSGGKNYCVLWFHEFVHLSSIYLSIILCFNVIHFNIYRLISLACIYLSTYLTIYCLSINQSIGLHILLSIFYCPSSICLSICPSIYMSIYPSVFPRSFLLEYFLLICL